MCSLSSHHVREIQESQCRLCLFVQQIISSLCWETLVSQSRLCKCGRSFHPVDWMYQQVKADCDFHCRRSSHTVDEKYQKVKADCVCKCSISCKRNTRKLVQTMTVCVVDHFVFMLGNTSKIKQTVSVSEVDHIILLMIVQADSVRMCSRSSHSVDGMDQ